MNTYINSEGALQGVAEAIRLAAKLLGLWREASPSAVVNSMEFLNPTFLKDSVPFNRAKSFLILWK